MISCGLTAAPPLGQNTKASIVTTPHSPITGPAGDSFIAEIGASQPDDAPDRGNNGLFWELPGIPMPADGHQPILAESSMARARRVDAGIMSIEWLRATSAIAFLSNKQAVWFIRLCDMALQYHSSEHSPSSAPWRLSNSLDKPMPTHAMIHTSYSETRNNQERAHPTRHPAAASAFPRSRCCEGCVAVQLDTTARSIGRDDRVTRTRATESHQPADSTISSQTTDLKRVFSTRVSRVRSFYVFLNSTTT